METLPWGNDLLGVNNQILEFADLQHKINDLKSDVPQCEHENRVGMLVEKFDKNRSPSDFVLVELVFYHF